MNNINKAYKEIWKILEKFDGNDLKKISPEIIEMIKENMDNNYEFELNKNLILSEQKLLPETRALLYYIYMNFLASEEEKKKIQKEEFAQILKLENEKELEYNTEIFKKKNN